MFCKHVNGKCQLNDKFRIMFLAFTVLLPVTVVFGQKKNLKKEAIIFYAAQPFVEYLPPNVDVSSLQSADKLYTFATPGEYEPLTCAMYSRQGLVDVSVTASALSFGKSKIPADRIDLRIVKYWFQRGYLWKGRFLIPDPLFHDDNLITVNIPKKENILHFKGLPVDPPTIAPFSIPAETVKQLWVTVHVPEQTEPGVYKGQLTFKTGKKIMATLPVQFEVLAFTLDKPNKDYGIYYPSRLTGDKWQTNPDSHKVNTEWTLVNEKIFRVQCDDLRARGITSPQFSMPIKVRSDGTVDFTSVKKMMDIREEFGLKDAPFFVTGLPNIMEAAESPQATDRYINIIQQVLNFFKANGWQKPYIYGIDEAHGDKLKKALPVYRKIKEIGGKIAVACYTKNQTASNWGESGWLEIAGDVIDWPIVAQHVVTVPEDEIRKAHELGLKIWFYALPQSHWDEYAPYEYRNNYGFWLFSSPADGIAPWGYQYAVGNPYDDFDVVPEGELTDCFAVYPTRDGIVPTILWEAFREGIDDCRYASTLFNLIVRLRALHGDAPILRETEQWMQAQKVQYIYVVNNLNQPDQFRPMLIYDKDLKEQLAKRPNLQILRRTYAEHILKLKQKYSNP